jgi:DNA-binding NarL/FixJ family response regulator
MPVMDGEEVARVLRQDFPDLPIILCSGWDDIPERVFTLVDAFVTKADGVEFLISAVRKVSMGMHTAHSPYATAFALAPAKCLDFRFRSRYEIKASQLLRFLLGALASR